MIMGMEHSMSDDINKLLIVPINESVDSELYDMLSLLIAPDKKVRLDKCKSDIDKKLGLFADLLVRIAIHQDLNIENDNILFGTNSYGKPFLENNKDYHFNISHTHNMIAVAVSNNPVGVDIEKVREIDLGIAKRFFTENEQNYIEKSQDGMYERFLKYGPKKRHILSAQVRVYLFC